MAERYYAEEVTAVRFRTLKRCFSASLPGPVAGALAAWFRLRGILHLPLKATYGVAGLESASVVSRDALPPRAASQWAPKLEQLADLKFTPLRYAIADTIGEKQQANVLLLD